MWNVIERCLRYVYDSSNTIYRMDVFIDDLGPFLRLCLKITTQSGSNPPDKTVNRGIGRNYKSQQCCCIVWNLPSTLATLWEGVPIGVGKRELMEPFFRTNGWSSSNRRTWQQFCVRKRDKCIFQAFFVFLCMFWHRVRVVLGSLSRSW